jgi:uncharacterized protein (TIGR02246 family)
MRDALQSEVETFLDQFRAAWDAGDARSYAALFTNEATYVIFLGEAFVGRDEIERNHLEVFARWQKGTRMAVKALGVRALGDDACSVLTIGASARKARFLMTKFKPSRLFAKEIAGFAPLSRTPR